MKSFIMLMIVFLMPGCGGGSGDSGKATDPDTVFGSPKLDEFTTELKGEDSESNNFNGMISFAKRDSLLLEGVMVTPYESIINLTGGGQSFTTTVTTFVDDDGYTILTRDNMNQVDCLPAFPSKVPETFKIGDFGTLAESFCTDNTSSTTNWRVEDAKNGRAELIISSVGKNQSGRQESTTTVWYTILADGAIVDFATNYFNPVQGYALSYWMR